MKSTSGPRSARRRRWVIPAACATALALATPASSATWTLPLTLSTPGHVVEHPAIDGFDVVWEERDEADHARIMSSSSVDGTKWSAAEPISPAGTDARNPVVDREGVFAIAAWERFDGAHWRVEAAERGGDAKWSQPVSLSAPDVDARGAHLDCARGFVGDCVIAFAVTGSNGASWINATTVVNKAFMPTVTMSTPGQSARDPQVASNPSNPNARAVSWRQRDSATGRWRAFVRLRNSPLEQWGPAKLASSASSGFDVGEAAVAWHIWTALPVWQQKGATYANTHLENVDPGGDPGIGPFNTVSPPGVEAGPPQLVSGGPKVGAAWLESRVGLKTTVAYATHDEASGTWSSPVTVSSPLRMARDLRVSPGATGLAPQLAAWEAYDGSAWRSQVAVGGFGTPWSAPVTLSAGDLDATEIDVADHAVVWKQSDSSSSFIQLARMLP